MTPDETQPAESTPQANADILRVMANPWRSRAYDALLLVGDTTTRRLVEQTGMAEASLNKHMTELAEIHFVRALNPEAPVRQRIWHAVPGGVRMGEFDETEEYTPQGREWLRSTHEAEGQIMDLWIEYSKDWPPEWRRAVERFNYLLPALTLEQFRQMAEELHAFGQRWIELAKRQEADGTPDTRPAFMVTHAIPYPMPYENDH